MASKDAPTHNGTWLNNLCFDARSITVFPPEPPLADEIRAAVFGAGPFASDAPETGDRLGFVLITSCNRRARRHHLRTDPKMIFDRDRWGSA